MYPSVAILSVRHSEDKVNLSNFRTTLRRENRRLTLVVLICLFEEAPTNVFGCGFWVAAVVAQTYGEGVSAVALCAVAVWGLTFLFAIPFSHPWRQQTTAAHTFGD